MYVCTYIFACICWQRNKQQSGVATHRCSQDTYTYMYRHTYINIFIYVNIYHCNLSHLATHCKSESSAKKNLTAKNIHSHTQTGLQRSFDSVASAFSSTWHHTANHKKDKNTSLLQHGRHGSSNLGGVCVWSVRGIPPFDVNWADGHGNIALALSTGMYIYIHMYICMCVRECVCIYIYIYIYIYIHTYTYI